MKKTQVYFLVEETDEVKIVGIVKKVTNIEGIPRAPLGASLFHRVKELNQRFLRTHIWELVNR